MGQITSSPYYQDLGTQSGRVSLGRVFRTYYLTCLDRVFIPPLCVANTVYANFIAGHYDSFSDEIIVINKHFMFSNLFINLLKQVSKTSPIEHLIEIKLLTNEVTKT